jgi:RHS repeat-associated protein
MTRLQERSADGQLTGYSIDFTYDEGTGRLSKITANDGREVHYAHDVAAGSLTKGNLTQVDGLADLFYLYKYEDPNDAHNVTWIQFGQNGTPVEDGYDTQGRVTQQTQGATVLTFSYVAARVQTNVTRKIFDDQGALLYTNASKYYFDEAGYPTSEVNPANYEMKSFYTANKDLEHTELRATVNGAAQKSTYYAFDGAGHKLTEYLTLDVADGGETITKSWTYDRDWLASEQVVSTADPTKLFRTEYTFLRDLVGVPVAIASVKRRNDDGSFAVTNYSYCTSVDVGNPSSNCPYLQLLKSTDGPRSDVSDITSYAYFPSTDESGCSNPPIGECHRKGKLWKITNALGQFIEYARYDQAGRVTRLRDANGVATDFEYDQRGHLLARKVRGANDGSEADDSITRYTYNDTGDATRVVQPDGSYIDFTYDGRRRLTGITDNLSNKVRYVLDSEGNHLREDTLDSSNTVTKTQSRIFNNLNRLYQLKNADNQATTFTYDVRGNPTSTLDALAHSATQSYDDLDRMTKLIRDAGAGGVAALTKYTYDAVGNIRTEIDPANLTTEYVYDSRGNRTSLVSPDSGTTNYTYNLADNRLSQTDARGVTSVYTYDALNRPTSIHYPSSQLDIAYFYDDADSVTGCSGSYPIGRRTRMTDSSGSTSYCYDNRGNVVRKTQTVGAATLSVDYGYDLANQLIAIQYPASGSLAYVRDGVGRIAEMDFQPVAGMLVSVVQGMTYLPFGPPTSYTFPGGQTLTKSYDRNYWATDIAGSVLNLHFRRDAMGNLSVLGNAPGALTTIERYDYDGLNRLSAIKDASGGNIQSFTYNATGDRLTRTDGGKPVETYTYPATSHRLQAVDAQARTYDSAGNTVADASGGRTYTYDDRNRLVGFSNATASASYQYNGLGERVSKTIGANTTLFLYDEGGALLGEYSTAGLPIRTMFYAGTTPVAIRDGGTIDYLHTDHLGAPRAVTSASATTIWTWPFAGNPFGDKKANEDPDGNLASLPLELRLPGQYYDKESGLSYNYYRDYDATIGRYVESDPIGLYGGISTYSYASSKPWLLTDRLGLCGQDCCKDVPWRNDPDSKTGATVWCCKHATNVCVNPDICKANTKSGLRDYDIDACAIVRSCARFHEAIHVRRHTNDCSSLPDGSPHFRPTVPDARAECEGYIHEIPCLNISNCHTTECEIVLRQVLDYKESQRTHFCFQISG